MSSVDPFVPGATLLQYRLSERISSSVWKAEDTRSGKAVAIKILSRQLPRDTAKRDALIREVRLGAALYHASIVNIIEVVPAGDALLMVTELVDGVSIAAFLKGKPVDRTTFFRLAYQMGDALRLLHAKYVIHGNLSADSILVTPAGQVKIAGMNVNTFLQKREGQPSSFHVRGNDPRAVAYMAPEQITSQPMTAQTDIYSLGLVLYEMAVGKPAFSGATAAEIARKVVGEQPPNPKVINPAIDNAVLAVTGRCLFKDPYRRYKDAKALTDDITKVEPDVVAFAASFTRTATTPGAAASGSAGHSTILLLADIVDYEKLEAEDMTAATNAAARLQQLLGEAVYLFDGKIVDPFGPRVVAELPSVENALEAARKGEFDFSHEQQEGDHIPIRMLLHAGEVMTKDGQVTGEAVTKGFEVLRTMQPLKLLITEEFAKQARGTVRLRDAGARSGVKLYDIVEPEPKVEPETEIHTADLEEQAKRDAEAAAAAAIVAKKRKRTQLAVVTAVVVVMIAAAGVVVWKRPKKPAETVTTAAPLPAATIATPRRVFIEPFKIEGTDPDFPARANTIRLATIEVLRTFPELRIADGSGNGVTTFPAKLRSGAAGPELVAGKSTPAPAADAASGIESLVRTVRAEVKLAPLPPMNPAAVNPFADAVAAFSATDHAKTEASVRAAIAADPKFLPAQILAMRFFDVQGRDADALQAAKTVASIEPTNADAARKIARAALGSGDLAGALSSFAIVLKTIPNDAEALNVIGRYATAVPDPAKLTVVLSRIPAMYSTVQQPDLLLAAGRIDDAVSKFYEIERTTPSNPALCLKIGRIAVLRHSPEIAQIELKKLQGGDTPYGEHLLKAYIAAANNARGDAAAELKSAQAASIAGDDYWTSAAEVQAIAGDARGTIEALEKAAARKEPTAAYILNNPLFRFLESDPRFAKVRGELTAEQNEVRTALANIAL